MHVRIWEFDVEPGAREAFERDYGPDGEWATLFRESPGYLGTDLLRDPEHEGRYLTLDFWASAAAYEGFVRDNRTRYEGIDRKLAPRVVRETRVGAFSRVPPQGGKRNGADVRDD